MAVCAVCIAMYLALPCQRSPPRIAHPRPHRSSAAGCSAGSASTGATCPGAGPAIPTRCSSPSSCCSRPRCRGSKRTGRGSWPGFPRSRRWPGAAVRGAGELGGPRLLPPRRQPPPAGARSWSTSRRARFRRTPAALRRLPGVGRYTAGAVASFAFERRRARGGHQRGAGAPAGVPPAGARRRRRAPPLGHRHRRCTPRHGRSAWAFNQAIMELGALICTARMAKCGECPVRGACKTGKKGLSTGD